MDVPACFWSPLKRGKLTLLMATVIEQQNVGAVGIFECGDRPEEQTEQVKPMADDDRRSIVRLRPELAA